MNGLISCGANGALCLGLETIVKLVVQLYSSKSFTSNRLKSNLFGLNRIILAQNANQVPSLFGSKYLILAQIRIA